MTSAFSAPAPRPRDPSRHRRLVTAIRLAVAFRKHALLIQLDEGEKRGCHDGRVDQKRHLSQEQGLTDDRSHHGEIHRVTHPPIWSGDHEFFRWCYRGRGPRPSQANLTK